MLSLKKSFSVCILLSTLITSSAHAWWKSNAVLGVSGGWIRHSGQYPIDLSFANPGGVPPVIFVDDFFIDDFHDAGAYWGVLAGYQFHRLGWIMGAELSLDWDHVDKTSVANPNNSNLVIYNRFSHNPLIALTGRLGYAFAPYFIAYYRLGAEGSKDKLNSTFSNTSGSVATEVPENTVRLLAGVGGEFPFTCSIWSWVRPLSLRVEYNYHAQRRSIGPEPALIEGTTNPTFLSHTRPKIHSFKSSLVWNFA
jgi:opacity protein-like surface antigen